MRGEVNIQAVVKKMQDKADSSEVQEALLAQEQRIQQIESTFIQVIEEVEGLTRVN